MTTQNIGLLLVFVSLKKLVQSVSSFLISLLKYSNFGEGEQILQRACVNNIAHSHISNIKEVLFKHTFDEITKEGIMILVAHVLINCLHLFVVNDFDTVLNILCSKVLWLGTLGRKHV